MKPMTVAQLIAALQEHDPEAEVLVDHTDGYSAPTRVTVWHGRAMII